MRNSFRAASGRHSLSSSARFRPLNAILGLVTLGMLAAAPSALRAHEFKAGSIEIGHPWSRETPAGASVAAGYLTLTNEGAQPDRLVAVSSEISDKAGIHQMAVNGDGVMTMRALANGLEIPAGGKVTLKPGSFHIMFEKLKRPIKEGDSFKGTLTFEKAGTVAVSFGVDAMNGKGEEQDGDAD